MNRLHVVIIKYWSSFVMKLIQLQINKSNQYYIYIYVWVGVGVCVCMEIKRSAKYNKSNIKTLFLAPIGLQL